MSKPKKLTKAQHRKLQRYVNQMLEAMRLASWTVTVKRGHCAAHNYAEIAPNTHGPTALLRLGPAFFDQNRNGQRQSIAHELVHLIWVRLDHAVEDCSEPLGKKRRRMANAVYARNMEHAVDQTAWLLAPNLPLPPKF